MHVNPYLIIEGEKYLVDDFTFRFSQKPNAVGLPATFPVFQGLDVVIRGHYPGFFLERWACASGQHKLVELVLKPLVLGSGPTRVFTFFDAHLVHFTKNYSEKKNPPVDWNDRYSDVTFGVTDLSDGTIRFIALTVLFMQPDLPDTIIIDEPELGLYPSAIAKLAGMIQSVSAKGCQVIVATQSTDLISHFVPEDIITVDQIHGESKFKRLKNDALQQWLEDYTIDDL